MTALGLCWLVLGLLGLLELTWWPLHGEAPPLVWNRETGFVMGAFLMRVLNPQSVGGCKD